MSFAAPYEGPAAIGRPSPVLVATDLDGRKVLMRQYAGRALVLNFFASWCRPCKRELPLLARASRSYAGRIAFLGVDEAESPDIVRPFVRAQNITYRIAIDQGQVAAAFGASVLPLSVFIDRRGIVRAISRGAMTPVILARDLDSIAH